MKTKKKEVKRWRGSRPVGCQICFLPFSQLFIDGKTQHGPWALMCLSCHDSVGVGLGTGKGQLYHLQSDGTWTKEAG